MGELLVTTSINVSAYYCFPAPIYDDIASHVMRYASDEVPKDNNWWYTADFRREYYDNEGKNRDIQQYAYYLYALGDMVLNKPGSGGQEGVKVKRMFVYYLGVRRAVMRLFTFTHCVSSGLQQLRDGRLALSHGRQSCFPLEMDSLS
jgi:hypothetical protein